MAGVGKFGKSNINLVVESLKSSPKMNNRPHLWESGMRLLSLHEDQPEDINPDIGIHFKHLRGKSKSV